TGEPLVKIGEEISRKLAYKPGSYFVKEYIRPKYASTQRSENGIKIMEMPDGILPKCRADESLLANIITMKFADHLPLYRISEIFRRDDVHVTRQLLSKWLLRIGEQLSSLYDVMFEQIIKSGRIFVDESHVNLLIPGNKKVHQAYMWVYVGGQGSDPPYRLYDFCLTRKHENAFNALQNYQGFLHSDKYGAY
ncbi:MAG: IS66 family transposase, partial [bacterium]|nr:IS66 family transposase [bacterium]